MREQSWVYLHSGLQSGVIVNTIIPDILHLHWLIQGTDHDIVENFSGRVDG
jgi:hypothetical protein